MIRWLLVASACACLVACGAAREEPAFDDGLLENGGFEADPQSPRPWGMYVHADGEAYRLELGAGHARSGSRGALIVRVRDEPWGGLFQSVAVDGLHGRTLNLSAWVRGDDLSENAQLLARVTRAGGAFAVSETQLAAADIDASEWRPLQVDIQVPDDAVALEVAIVLNGGGRLQVDDVALHDRSPDGA
jgi:hypothetical protein